MMPILVLLAAVFVFGQEPAIIDENALFADTATVVQSVTAADSVEAPKKSAGFSGEISTAALAGFPRDDFGAPNLSSYVVGNLMADARLLDGIKGFANAEARYQAQYDTVSFHLREIFMDVNVKNRVYFRAGKQVLQWGRCWFWNPTDLINVEQKAFIQKIGYREGAFGLKTHVPIGTRANFYGFIDTRGADTLSKTAGAIKAEVLVKRTEMAVALWDRKGRPPVMGADFSTRVFGLDWSGEASLFREDIEKRMVEKNGTLLLVSGDSVWSTRVATGFTHTFDVNGIPDRLSVTVEGYYNASGYDSRIFEDKALYQDGTSKLDLPFALPPGITLPTEPVTKLDFFIRNGLYRPNEHAKYYAALFTSFSRFINSDMTLSFNAIGNIPEKCAVVAGAVSYRDLRDLSLGLTIIGNVGPDDREYTYLGNALSVQLSAGLSF